VECIKVLVLDWVLIEFLPDELENRVVHKKIKNLDSKFSIKNLNHKKLN
jgi:hypothetical protein